MKKILLVVDYKNMFRGNLPGNPSLNVKKMVKFFQDAKYDVETINYNDLINSKRAYKDYYIIYTSSQNRIYKQYLDDILFYLSEKNTIIPKYEIFKAHENKGYQEILKKSLNINSNNGYIFCDYDSLKLKIDGLKFPVVMKTINGAGSRGVIKVSDKDELLKKFNEISYAHKSVWFNLKRVLKKKFNYKYDEEWYEKNTDGCYVVIQNFIEDLDGDWKVLVFNDKFYTLKRGIKDNDFRASGSGILDFEMDTPNEVLDFSKQVFDKLDAPFMSLDVAFDNKKNCHLIEFQGVHFGPKTLTESKGYYKKENNKWKWVEESPNLEKSYVDSYVEYIEKSNRKN